MASLEIRELRIMHACELGAVGVYRGHKCVARYVYRSSVAELDEMRSHELSHVDIFRTLLSNYNARPCLAYPLFFWGGLFYGVSIGLLGLRSIGTSTNTIESIVIHELEMSAATLSHDPVLVRAINQVKIDEMSHQESGESIANGDHWLSYFVGKVASVGAYTAKRLSAVL